MGGVRLFARSAVRPGGSVLVCVRPEEIEIAEAADSRAAIGATSFPAAVAAMADQPTVVTIRLDCGFQLTATLPRRVARDLALLPGVRVRVRVSPEAVHLIAVSNAG